MLYEMDGALRVPGRALSREAEGGFVHRHETKRLEVQFKICQSCVMKVSFELSLAAHGF